MTSCNFTGERFADGRFFHSRPYTGERGPMFEVYSMGLDQWAECHTRERAELIAALLNSFYNADMAGSRNEDSPDSLVEIKKYLCALKQILESNRGDANTLDRIYGTKHVLDSLINNDFAGPRNEVRQEGSL